MKRKYKDLIKNVLLFTLSSFIPKVISFFLVPLYTSYLTTTEYGISDLIGSTVALMFPVLTLDIRDAVLRFTLDKDYSRKDCLNISMRIVFYDFLFLTVITVLQFCFNFIKINNIYILFFDIMVIVNSLYDIFNAYCKGTDRVKTIVVASCLNSLTTLTLNILFIVVLKMGLYGFLLANTFGFLIADLIFIFNTKLYKEFSFNYSKKQQKDMIKYSFPVIFSVIAWWINNSSDRYIITLLIGVSASGIYAVSSKIPTILTTFQNIFVQAWSISAIKEFDKDDTDGFIGNIYTLMSCMLCVICSLIIIFNLLISKILFKGDFFFAWKYVPFLCLAVSVDGLALLIGNLFYAVKDTRARTLTTIYGAVTNTILNFVLIPKLGAYGAAVATFIGYFIGFVTSRVIVKRYINMKTNFKVNDFCIFILFLQALLAYFGNKYIILQVLILLTILFLYRKSIIILSRKFISLIKNKRVK